MNSGGQTDDSITRINAQFVEMDDKSFEEQQALIDAFSLPPSMIIRTRKSLHTYWFVKDAKVAQFRPIQKALVQHFGGDPACVNESRVMRLPGFYHCKKEHFIRNGGIRRSSLRRHFQMWKLKLRRKNYMVSRKVFIL